MCARKEHEQSGCHRTPEISDRKRRAGSRGISGAFQPRAVDCTSHCRGDDTVASQRVHLHTSGLLPVAGRKRAVSPRTWSRHGLVRKLRPRPSVRQRSSSPPAWRRLPVGAELAPEGGVHFRVWAPRVGRVEVEIGNERVPLEAEPRGYHSGRVPSIGAGARYAFRLDGGPRLPRSRLALPARGPARAVRGDRPDRLRLDGRRVAGRPARGPGHLRDAHRHLHAGRHLGRRQRASCRSWRGLGITVVEVMPVADFPGDFGWGYDGVDLFAPTRLYGRPDDFRALRRSRARGRPRRHPGRRLQPLRPGRQLSRAVLRATTSPTRHRTDWGDGDQLRRRGLRAGPRVLHRERRLLDRRVPPRRASPRRHAGHLRRLARAHPGRDRAPRAGAAPAAGRFSSWPRTSRRTRGSSARWRPAATASTRCGTTTSTTAPRWRSPAGAEAYYTDYSRHAAGAHLGRQARLPLPGPALRLAGQAPWHARAGTSRRRPSSTSSQNHDQVANSARGPALPPADQPRPLPRHDRAAPAGPGDADAVPGAGVRRLEPIPLLRRSPAGAGASWCARAAREFLAQFPSLAGRRGPGGAARPRRPPHLRALASSTSASASATREAYALHLDLLRLRREDPVFRAQGGGGVDGAVLGPEAFVLRFFGVGIEPTIGCCWSTSGRDLDLPGDRRALARAARGHALEPRLVERGRPLRRRRHARARSRPTAGVLPGHAAVVFGPAR